MNPNQIVTKLNDAPHPSKIEIELSSYDKTITGILVGLEIDEKEDEETGFMDATFEGADRWFIEKVESELFRISSQKYGDWKRPKISTLEKNPNQINSEIESITILED